MVKKLVMRPKEGTRTGSRDNPIDLEVFNFTERQGSQDNPIDLEETHGYFGYLVPHDNCSKENILIQTTSRKPEAIHNMAANHPILPQPDFVNATQGFVNATQGLTNTTQELAAVAQGLTMVQNEFSNIANIPAVNQGGLVAQLAAINVQLRAMNNTNVQLLAGTHNARVKVVNAAREAGDPLTPLRDATTNLPIPNFPNRPAAINRMTAAMLNPILTALQLPTAGTVAQKKRMLRINLGLNERTLD